MQSTGSGAFELPGMLGELARVTAPGGRILLGFFDGEPGEEFAHAVAPAHYWSAEALAALLVGAAFEVVHAERREREPGAVGSIRPHGAVIAERRRPGAPKTGPGSPDRGSTEP